MTQIKQLRLPTEKLKQQSKSKVEFLSKALGTKQKIITELVVEFKCSFV